MNLTPICIMSFNRPDLLDLTLHSLKNQSRSIEGSPIALFQDWSDSDSALHAECVSIFKTHFPSGFIFAADVNLGVALNFDRAERWSFAELGADVAYFFEDDMVLSYHYIATLDRMSEFALGDEKIAYVAAYGNHRLRLDEQISQSHLIIEMDHKWGFALTKRQWLKQKPFIDGYLDIVRKRPYKERDNSAIRQYFSSLGYSSPGTSQDAAKDVASCVLGTAKINTLVSLAKYIGEEGLHSTPEAYAAAGYGETQIFDREPSVERPSPDFIDLLIEENRRNGKVHLQRFPAIIIPDMPHMPSQEIDFLERHLSTSKCYLEYGAGGSTRLAARFKVPQIISVESDNIFLRAVSDAVALEDSTSDYVPYYADIGQTREWGNPVDNRSFRRWPDYVHGVWTEISRRNWSPDFVLIDGRFRAACALCCIINSKAGTILMVDDYEGREHSYSIINKYSFLVDKIGRAAVFEAPPGVDLRRISYDITRYCLDFS